MTQHKHEQWMKENLIAKSSCHTLPKMLRLYTTTLTAKFKHHKNTTKRMVTARYSSLP